ncbi:MAG: NAD(P)H-dependent oxidoreductase [Phycisphaerales bacterium]|nr:NAD(P)H-dependent oxidoreductase [Phycisphaerales bacterium]
MRRFQMENRVKTILKVNSSGQRESSVSRQLVAKVADKLLRENPGAGLVERDVSEGLPPVNEAWIGANFTPRDQRSDEQKAVLGTSDSLVEELRAADVIVVGLPIYNFGIPASLKLWVDQVVRAGETFSYDEAGPVGLLEGKRAIVTVASGGVETGSPVDFASTYMKQVLGFIGITDITVVSANGLAMDADTAIATAHQAIDELQPVAA